MAKHLGMVKVTKPKAKVFRMKKARTRKPRVSARKLTSGRIY